MQTSWIYHLCMGLPGYKVRYNMAPQGIGPIKSRLSVIVMFSDLFWPYEKLILQGLMWVAHKIS